MFRIMRYLVPPVKPFCHTTLFFNCVRGWEASASVCSYGCGFRLNDKLYNPLHAGAYSVILQTGRRSRAAESGRGELSDFPRMSTTTPQVLV